MRIQRWVAGCLLIVGFLLAGCKGEQGGVPTGSRTPEGQVVPIYREFKGQQGPFPDASFVVVQRQEAWQALWAPRTPPEVDFSRQTVLAATMGQQSSAGREITITDVRATGQRIVAYVGSEMPEASAATRVASFPYHMVVVPKLSQPVTFVLIDRTTPLEPMQDQYLGQQNRITQPRVTVVRDQESWKALWIEAFGADAEIPAIDFTQYMAAAVFMGQRPTAGYAVMVVSAERIDDRLTVNYRTTVPKAGEVVAQVVTSPYAIAILPLSTLPAAFRDLGRP